MKTFLVLALLATSCVPAYYAVARKTAHPCAPVTLAFLDFGLVATAAGFAVLAAHAGHSTGAAIDSGVAIGVAVADTWAEVACER